MSAPLAPELDGLLLENLGDIEAAYKRLQFVERAVFDQMGTAVEAWLPTPEWQGHFDYLGEGLWVAPRHWSAAADHGEASDAWWAFGYGAGEGRAGPADDALFLTRICRVGQGSMGFALNQEVSGARAWKALLRENAAKLTLEGFRLDDVGVAWLDVQLDHSMLARGARESDFEEAMSPLISALEQIKSAEPLLTELLNIAREKA